MMISRTFLIPAIISFSFFAMLISCKDKSAENGLSTEAPVVEEVSENYGTGAISRKYTKKNGKIHGLMEDYFPDGKLKAQRYFEEGKQVGKTTLYFPSGKVKEVQYYVNGLKNGGDTVFYENGQPEFALSYKDEKRHGYLRKWSPEGELIYEAKFENDQVVEVKGEKVVTQKD